jgi:endonuclease-3
VKNKKSRAQDFLDQLVKAYPDAQIELDYKKNDPWQLLVVVSLSAQTTDKKVNEISPALFKKFKNIKAFADASPEEVEPYIKTLGLYRNKAKHLVLAAQKILMDFAGKVPSDRARLESLAGVGKKTAAVVVANAFHQPAIAVDTHVARVARRLGLTTAVNPDKIEAELTCLWPGPMLLKAHHTLIIHGRVTCIARKPKCNVCPVTSTCPRVGVTVWE